MNNNNLLEETKHAMRQLELTPEDIEWIGNEEYTCSWDEFTFLADVDYDDGYGAQMVASDLVVVFRDGSWLSRRENDGSEWWKHNAYPIKTDSKPITKLVSLTNERGDHEFMWADIKEMQDEEEWFPDTQSIYEMLKEYVEEHVGEGKDRYLHRCEVLVDSELRMYQSYSDSSECDTLRNTILNDIGFYNAMDGADEDRLREIQSEALRRIHQQKIKFDARRVNSE